MTLTLIATAGAVIWIVASSAGRIAPLSPAQTEMAAAISNLQVYAVNRRVSGFPTNEDLSTPEAAYANLSRLWASGDLGFWKRISEPSLAARVPDETGTRKLSAKAIASCA